MRSPKASNFFPENWDKPCSLFKEALEVSKNGRVRIRLEIDATPVLSFVPEDQLC